MSVHPSQRVQGRQLLPVATAAAVSPFVSDDERFAAMAKLEKPNARGPSAGEKAQVALGKKLNRPAKPPPTMPGKKAEKNEPRARRVSEEVDDL
jgi:hypothetical protein